MSLYFEADIRDLISVVDYVEATGMVYTDSDITEEDESEPEDFWEVEEETVSEEVDNSTLGGAFVSAFLDSVYADVPVDTGHLMGSIGASSEGTWVYAWAETPYAQHVEFGTYKMAAQPYFIPAIEAGIAAAQEEASMAAQIAYDNVYSLAEEIFVTGFSIATDGGTIESTGFIDFGFGLVGGIALLALAFVPLLYLYGTMRTLMDPLMANAQSAASDYSNANFLNDSLMQYITIV